MPPLPFQSPPFPMYPVSALEADQLGLHLEVRNIEFWQETGRRQASRLPQ